MNQIRVASWGVDYRFLPKHVNGIPQVFYGRAALREIEDPRQLRSLVFCHALADSLQHRETAEKQGPDQPTPDRGIAQNHAGKRKTVPFQLRISLNPRKRDMTANDSSDSSHKKKAATKSEETKQAENE